MVTPKKLTSDPNPQLKSPPCGGVEVNPAAAAPPPPLPSSPPPLSILAGTRPPMPRQTDEDSVSVRLTE